MEMASLNAIMEWTFMMETEVPKEVTSILVEGEEPIIAYKTVRDVAVITNKRLMIGDKQGITGKKMEIYTIPFKAVDIYSTENAGTFDLNSEITLWTRHGTFKLNLNRKVDVRKLDRIIAQNLLK